MTTVQSRLLGLATTVGLALFVIGTPVLLIAIGAVPSFDAFGWSTLTSPDDGTLAMAVVGLVAWAAWIVMTASLVVEGIATLRGLRAPSIPGLGMPQLAAGRLIATASLLFVASPLGLQQLNAPPSDTAPAPTTVVSAPSMVQESPAPTLVPVEEAVTRGQETARYVSRRGDSLWKIAQEHLGDGRRYTEIVALNREKIDGRPDFIPIGLVLRLPVDQPAAPTVNAEKTYVVEPGDTLSEIAEDELGDPLLYPEIFKASKDTVQPDGEKVRDPNLIRPGWTLTIPGADPVAPAPIPQPAPTAPPTLPHRPPPLVAPEPPTVTPVEAPPAEAAPSSASMSEDDTQVPGWVLPGLTGGGALLAGGLLLVVRAHRRTQLRYRRPGHVIALPPPELLPVEKTIHVAGTPMVPKIEKLDDLLRHLRASVETIPDLTLVEIADDHVTLHLAEEANLPAPWEGAGDTWAAKLTADVASKADEPAPYPLLVTVGQSDSGRLWLANLEELQTAAVAGDKVLAEAFARHLVAELALNPWAARVEIEAVGIADELGSITHRLNHHKRENDAFIASIEKELTDDTRVDGNDPEAFHAIITSGPISALTGIRALVANHPWRPGTAIVSFNMDSQPDAVAVQLANGRLRIPSLSLDVIAAGLTPEEAAACAAIVDLTHRGETAPMPVNDATDCPLEEVIDAGGAIRSDLTEARPEGPAGEDSVLPLPAADYEIYSATTAEDIEVLAPVTPLAIRVRVEDADPTLDADLAFWNDEDVRLPKLRLLGPVSARAYGDVKDIAARKPYYTEMLAYLCLHTQGVAATEAASAFSLTKNRLYVDLAVIRHWLGSDPRTGEDFMPKLKATRGAREHTESRYRVQGVLSDFDLFRRLRARAQARGAEGIVDLERALQLVSGEPFSQLREQGWSWLLEGERLDHVITCAIVDVAHIATTHALAVDDLELARMAAETAYKAAPYDDVSRLDLIQVASITGHAEIAERHLIDGIFNRSDDDYGPIDPPDRTARIVKSRGWDQAGRAAHE